MVNYGNSIIYKLCCKDFNIDKIYVGSTCNFSRRKAQHKSTLYDTNKNETKLYQFILNNGGWKNWDMVEIMKYPCNDKRELEKKENEIMKELKAELNSYSSFNTEEERKEKNRIREQNRDKESKKISTEKYRNKKENKIKEMLQQKKHYEENKEKINEIIICECGCKISKQNLIRHKQSKKHIKLMEEKNINFD